MLFKKKRKLDILEEKVIPKEEEFEIREVQETTHEQISEDSTHIKTKEERAEYAESVKTEHETDIKKIEKMAVQLLLGAKDPEIKRRALELYGKIKLIQAIMGSDAENVIKLLVGEEVPQDYIEFLKSKDLVETVYKIPGIEIKAKDKEEISKKIEELLKECYELREDVKEAFMEIPYRVDEDRSEIAGKLYELGIFEIYLLPKGFFDVPTLDIVSAEKLLKEIDKIIESLPEHIGKYLRS
ncbi:hypothetical protein [Archaeoglobus sp.]